MSESELCWYLGFRTKLDPTKEQAEYFSRASGTARLVFNWGLGQWIKQYEEYKNGLRASIICQNNFRHSFSLTWSGKTCDIRRSL